VTVRRRSVVARVASSLRRGRAAREVVPQATEPLRLGYVVHGEAGVHPGSAHIRVVRRVNHEVVAGRLAARQLSPRAVVDGETTLDVDVVLVQRDALPAELTTEFLVAVRASGCRLVAEVDDDFFSADARRRLEGAEYDRGRLDGVEAVVRAADVVVVSTDALAAVVSSSASEVVVVPNELDPEFWSDDLPVQADVPLREEEVPGGRPRLHALYMGSSTHHEDLALLRPVFEGLVTPEGVPVVLDVVGVTDVVDDDPWYERISVPQAHHPEFVRWLRSLSARWSVGVAPLTDAPFNRSKSDLKFLEYTMLGLPTVASASVPYAEVEAHGGRLASTTDEWRRAVLAAVRDGVPESASAYVRGRRLLGSTSAWGRAIGLETGSPVRR
jgi:hypothetical protein